MAIFAAEADEEISTRESADQRVALEDFLATFREIYHDHRADPRTEVGSADGECRHHRLQDYLALPTAKETLVVRLFTLHSANSIRAVPSAEHPDILILEFRGEEIESLVFGEGGGDLISVKLTQGQVAELLAAIRGRTGLGV